MAVGRVFTVMTFVTKHPVGRVYVIFAVPADAPVTMPPVPMVATPLLLLLHDPPGDRLDNAIE